jgi:hypothetical protein
MKEHCRSMQKQKEEESAAAVRFGERTLDMY